MVRHTLKILQQMLQNFKSVSDHFGTLCIKGLKRVFFHPQEKFVVGQRRANRENRHGGGIILLIM